MCRRIRQNAIDNVPIYNSMSSPSYFDVSTIKPSSNFVIIGGPKTGRSTLAQHLASANDASYRVYMYNNDQIRDILDHVKRVDVMTIECLILDDFDNNTIKLNVLYVLGRHYVCRLLLVAA